MQNKRLLSVNFFVLLWAYNCQGLHPEEKLEASLAFWTEGVCTVPNTKTIFFHGIFRDDSDTLGNYFKALIQGISDLCDVTILSKMYRLQKEPQVNSLIEDHGKPISNAKKNTQAVYLKDQGEINGNLKRSSRGRAIYPEFLLRPFRNTRKIMRIKHGKVIDMWNINIILLDDNRFFEEVLESQAPFHWSRQEYFIMLAIWNDTQIGSEDPKHLIDKILRKLWDGYEIQNVFFHEPLRNISEYRIYSFNPFAKINDTAWGKLEVLDFTGPESKLELFHRLSLLTKERTKNMNGKTLRVSLFESASTQKLKERLPLQSLFYRKNGYNGMDAIILGILSKHMNFKVQSVPPTRGGKYGHQLQNGTFTGALADIADRLVDVCFVTFFVKSYGKNVDIMRFTTYVDFDKVCVIVPKANKIPKGLRIFHIFQPSVWYFAMFSQVLLQLAWYYIQILSTKRRGKVDFQQTALKVFLLSAGHSMKLPSSNAERILLVGLFIGSMTILGTFNGVLYKCFAKDMFYKDINRLSELDESNLPIMISSHSMSDLFGEDDKEENPVMSSLRKKMILGHNFFDFPAIYRNVSVLLRDYTFPIVREVYVDKDGTHLIHRVAECPGYYYLAYVLPKNSILFSRINSILGNFNQAGLTDLWKRRTQLMQARKMKINLSGKNDDNNHFIAFTLSDMQTCFSSLGFGLFVSVIVFCKEKGWLRICCRKEITIRR